MNTRKRIKTVLTLAAVAMAVLVLVTTSASAGIVLEEQFDYEPLEANINGQDGGTGFDGPWVSTISHGRIYWLAEGSSFTDANGDELPVAGNALSRYGSAGRAQAHRTISAASQAALTGDNTTIWFSQLFAGPSANRNAMFIFGTQPIKHTNNPYELAAAGDGFGLTIANFVGGVGGNGNGSINALAYDNSITVTSFVEGTYTPSPTTAISLIVGKINWKPNGTPDEFFLFNITDMSTEPAEADAIASITNLDFNQSAFNMIAMYDGTNAITDEIRFGTSFVNVMGATDPNAPDVDAGSNWITWSGEPVTIDATVTEKAGSEWTDLTYTWTAIPDGSGPDLDVVITGADTEDATVTITKTAPTGDATIVTLTLAVGSAGKEPVTSAISIDVYDDSCKAAEGTGTLEIDLTDFDGNCITNLKDYAVMAAAWLDDYTSTEPAPKL